MKKLKKILLIVALLAIPVIAYASVSTDLDAWWANLNGYNNSNAAKARYQDIMININQDLNELQAMNQAGEFDKLPASVKTKFLWAWQQLDGVRDTLQADSDFMEAINWTP